MSLRSIDTEGNQIILHTDGLICSTIGELTGSAVFSRIVEEYIQSLKDQDSPLLDDLGTSNMADGWADILVSLLRALSILPIEQAVKLVPDGEHFLYRRDALHWFVEGLYDFWRSFDRFMVCHSEAGPGGHDLRPYRTFTLTVEQLTDLVRALYRDICENITGEHPRVYRQVAAGCEVGLIAVDRQWKSPGEYEELLQGIPFVRQVLINPPLILNPPMNKRTGQFDRISDNPLAGLNLDKDKWMCYPAQVGPLVVFVYFHQKFIGLGCSLANLFELATDEQIASGPDAVYLYGVPAEDMVKFGDPPTVIYDDETNNLLIAEVPGEDKYGYFGYVKKMVLTLHNIVMMKRGRMPFHGAMTRIVLRSGAAANVLMIGDTAAGKSESIEALRTIGKDKIRDLRIVADDMGSLHISEDGRILGYGTEIGAFVRLDDLQDGYAFGQIDRAIIMSPHKVNARVVLPVTTLPEILKGYQVDILLYANNYEEVDDQHPAIERFSSAETALHTFRDAATMAKGTTTSTGLVHTYFANIFGPAQYPDLHDTLANNVFQAAFSSGVFVGQMRTRLGISGYEQIGPRKVAEALLDLIESLKTKSQNG
ncbi:MAG TPA: phosphoenolpyruvate carboxykinase [Armatimonadota bacterium]|nr:phosphoenolpyruvate carboxykinase [Armatimonadota bacterium]